jgi:prevent-host-death family protein
MRTAPMQELKENLATLAEIAAGGETVEITKHNKPFIRLMPATAPGLHIGRNAGQAKLRAAVAKSTAGAYLKVLASDRE